MNIAVGTKLEISNLCTLLGGQNHYLWRVNQSNQLSVFYWGSLINIYNLNISGKNSI